MRRRYRRWARRARLQPLRSGDRFHHRVCVARGLKVHRLVVFFLQVVGDFFVEFPELRVAHFRELPLFFFSAMTLNFSSDPNRVFSV